MVEDFYITLIYKELEGSITPAEQRELDTWSRLEDNQKLRSEIANAWNLSEDYGDSVPIDLDQEYAEMQSKMIETSKAKVVSLPKRNLRKWLSIAAGVLILIGSVFVIRQFTQVTSAVVSHTATKSGQYYMLEDGSEIYLQKGATISYEQPFDKSRRRIMLEGEGVFHVSHDASWPLDVNTSRETITVLGTKFHVNHNPEITEVQLIEGKVKVSGNNGTSIVLSPGQKVSRRSTDKDFNNIVSISDNDFSWQTKKLVFKNQRISDFIQSIESYYDVSIALDNADYGDCRLTAVFEDKSLEQVLEVITEIHGVEIQRNNNEIILRGGRCE